MGHDGILTVQASEDTLGRLRCTENRYLSGLPVKERMAILRRAKSTASCFLQCRRLHRVQFECTYWSVGGNIKPACAPAGTVKLS